MPALSRLRVRASTAQAGELVEWTAAWPERTWAVEGVDGLRQLLAQQLVAADERVLDIQPKLGSRVRLPSSRSANKNVAADCGCPVHIFLVRAASGQQVCEG